MPAHGPSTALITVVLLLAVLGELLGLAISQISKHLSCQLAVTHLVQMNHYYYSPGHPTRELISADLRVMSFLSVAKANIEANIC